MNGLTVKLIFSFLFLGLSLFGQKSAKKQNDTSLVQPKTYWEVYKEKVDRNWPFFCPHWGKYDTKSNLTITQVMNLLDSPFYVFDVWDNSYEVKQFRFYYKNLEYTQNDTTLAYESFYVAYSFYSPFPIDKKWKAFIRNNIEEGETFIIDEIYIQNKKGTGFIVLDPIVITTK